MTWHVPSWQSFEAGAEAAEEIARDMGAPLTKADPKILTTPGFEQAVRALIRMIAKATSGPERDAMRAMAKKLDQDWPTLTSAQRAAVIASAAKHIIGIPELVVGKVQKAIAVQMTEIVRIAKRDTGRVHRLQINPSFTARDERIIRFASESQGSYITDKYRNRAFSFEQRARDIVSKGLSDGMGRKDIGAILRQKLVDPALRTSEAYWETVASVHTARARSWGQLAGFQDAEITEFEVEALLDEVTTDQCRFLHGKRFSVAKAVERYQQVEESQDPEAVKKLQPWIKVGQNDAGDRVLFVDRGASRKVIASVTESGVGVADKMGSFATTMNEAALQKLGIGTPPYHGRCRTTIVPA